MSLWKKLRGETPKTPQSAPAEIDFVKMTIPLDELIARLKEPKDIRVTFRSEKSMVTAFCKACQVQIMPIPKEAFLWYVCPRCKCATFTVIANLARDFGLAERFGGTFEYEVFYLREFPPGFEPPAPSPL